MDPISVAILSGLATNAASSVGGLVSGWLGGRLKPDEVRQLAVRHWGCLLFELRWNLIQLAGAVTTARANKRTVPVLHSLFSQALLGDLARLSPHPAMLALAAKLVAEQRNTERLVGLALTAGTQLVTPPREGVTYQQINPTALWLGRVSAVTEDQLRLYNDLREFVVKEGREVFKKWKELERSLVPLAMPLDFESAAKERVLGDQARDPEGTPAQSDDA